MRPEATIFSFLKNYVRIRVAPEALRLLDNGETIADPGAWYGFLGGAQYVSTINRDLIEAGPTWNPTRPLPNMQKTVVRPARTVLATLVRNHTSWRLKEIMLDHLYQSEPERWFFVVQFERDTGRPSEQGSLQIPVTFNGRAGTVRKAGTR